MWAICHLALLVRRKEANTFTAAGSFISFSQHLFVRKKLSAVSPGVSFKE